MSTSKDLSDLKFEEWLRQSLARNPNLRPLAEELQSYSVGDFSGWIQDALTRMIIEGKQAAEVFSPGELIVGVSPISWRDDFYALIALLEPSVRGMLVRGVVNSFNGIAAFQDDNNVSANDGRNWERLTVELMRLTRDLRAPLCEIEATPLDALKKLITVQFPKSRAVLEEGLLLWRAFAHQIARPAEWEKVFEAHPRFREEYSPLVAFAHVVRFPEYAQFYLSNWSIYRQYRLNLLSSRAEARAFAKSTLEALFTATENVLRFAADRGNAGVHLDATYELATGIDSIPGVTVMSRELIQRTNERAWNSQPKSIASHRNMRKAAGPAIMDRLIPNAGLAGLPMGVLA